MTVAKDIVVIYASRLGTPMYDHEKVTLNAVAGAIAKLKRGSFGGWCDASHHRSSHTFYVPDDTLLSEEATDLNIQSERDFFGGVVPHAFVRTKAITHPLIGDTADRPDGWSFVFSERVRGVVLPGYTAFSARDARLAAIRMLPLGPVRLKKPFACGGAGQTVITNLNEINAFLEVFPNKEMAEYGLVLESHLHQVTTLSVGKIVIDDLAITYHGTQRLAINNEGRFVYGGSDLVCVRGDWNALDRVPMNAETRCGVLQAQAYDKATRAYPAFIASRRNYDVGQGVDSNGQRRSGVFEASWRSGGASAAELAAFAAFVEDPNLQILEASTVKEYGTACGPPPGAVIHYWGDDPRDGPILRYTITHKPGRTGFGFSKRSV
jgi:hypothetical protein